MSGSVTIQGQITATPVGTVTVGPYNQAANSSNNYQATAVTLASGTNTITVPSWAAGVIINPATSNVQTLTFKGVAGDTGTVIDNIGPSVIAFSASPPATFVLTAGGLFTTITEIIFF